MIQICWLLPVITIMVSSIIVSDIEFTPIADRCWTVTHLFNLHLVEYVIPGNGLKLKKKENRKYSTPPFISETQKLLVFKGQFCRIFLKFLTISFFFAPFPSFAEKKKKKKESLKRTVARYGVGNLNKWEPITEHNFDYSYGDNSSGQDRSETRVNPLSCYNYTVIQSRYFHDQKLQLRGKSCINIKLYKYKHTCQ